VIGHADSLIRRHPTAGASPTPRRLTDTAAAGPVAKDRAKSAHGSKKKNQFRSWISAVDRDARCRVRTSDILLVRRRLSA
jgi:hypothetical protein